MRLANAREVDKRGGRRGRRKRHMGPPLASRRKRDTHAPYDGHDNEQHQPHRKSRRACAKPRTECHVTKYNTLDNFFFLYSCLDSDSGVHSVLVPSTRTRYRVLFIYAYVRRKTLGYSDRVSGTDGKQVFYQAA
jgi:hypothetical protein